MDGFSGPHGDRLGFDHDRLPAESGQPGHNRPDRCAPNGAVLDIGRAFLGLHHRAADHPANDAVVCKKIPEMPETPVSVSSLQASVEAFAKNIEQLNKVLVASTKTIDQFRKNISVKRWEETEKAFSTIVETLMEIKASGDRQGERLKEAAPLLDELLAIARQDSARTEKIADSHSSLGDELKAIGEVLRKRDAVAEMDRKRWGRILDAVRNASEE